MDARRRERRRATSVAKRSKTGAIRATMSVFAGHPDDAAISRVVRIARDGGCRGAVEKLKVRFTLGLAYPQRDGAASGRVTGPGCTNGTYAATFTALADGAFRGTVKITCDEGPIVLRAILERTGSVVSPGTLVSLQPAAALRRIR